MKRGAFLNIPRQPSSSVAAAQRSKTFIDPSSSYFDEDDDDDGGGVRGGGSSCSNIPTETDEEDPLEAFMAGLSKKNEEPASEAKRSTLNKVQICLLFSPFLKNVALG
jgi:hypothetical protein